MRFDTLSQQPLAATLAQAVANRIDIANCAFTGDAGSQDLFGLGFERCLFVDCRLTGCDFTRATFRDVQFLRCDLSGAHFDDAGLHSVQFCDCRALGAYFSGALWDKVSVSGGVFDYVNLCHAEWRSCTLAGSFRDAALAELTVKKTDVAGCNFSRSDWSHAHIAGLDFTKAVIEGGVFSPLNLNGIVVTQEQAADLARLLGVIIKS